MFGGWVERSHDREFAPQMAGFASLPGGLMVPTSAATTGANAARGCRYIVPRSGTLSSILVPVGTSSGNIDVGVYNTVATTRALLGSSGAVACPTASTMAQVNLSASINVYRGQHIDLAISCDNGTATFGRVAVAVAAHAVLPTGTFVSPDGGAPYLIWTAATSYPLSSTLAETAINAGSNLYPLFPVIT